MIRYNEDNQSIVVFSTEDTHSIALYYGSIMAPAKLDFLGITLIKDLPNQLKRWFLAKGLIRISKMKGEDLIQIHDTLTKKGFYLSEIKNDGRNFVIQCPELPLHFTIDEAQKLLLYCKSIEDSVPKKWLEQKDTSKFVDELDDIVSMLKG